MKTSTTHRKDPSTVVSRRPLQSWLVMDDQSHDEVEARSPRQAITLAWNLEQGPHQDWTLQGDLQDPYRFTLTIDQYAPITVTLNPLN